MERFTSENYIGENGLCASFKELNGYAGTHYHEFFELEYVCSGAGSYVLDGVEYEIKSGMLFLMTPVNFHSVLSVNATVFNVMFSEKLCNTELLARCVESKGGLALCVDESDRALFESVLNELCQSEHKPLYTSSLLNVLLCKSLDYKKTGELAPSSISRAVIYLLRHFRENPSLSTVASVSGYTPSYFSALFKSEIGEGFKEYLDRLRFDYAHKLLRHSNLSVIEVCRESGFEDYPNFIRRFTKRFSVSPGEVTKGI